VTAADLGATTATPTDLLTLTAELVDQPSESFAERPFVDWLEGELSGLRHLEVTRVGDNVVARTDLGRPARVMLVGHSDTVPANGNGAARLEGDILWGVGSADMKGGLAIFLALAREVTAPAVDVTYVIYAREEVARVHSGLGELATVRPDLLTGDCAVLGEPTGATIEAGCQGALRFELTLAGSRAHTARPWMGRNAVHRLAPVLTALASYQARAPVIDGCEYREALQAVAINGGVAGNVVPDEAQLRIHHRFAPDRSTAEAEQFVREMLAPHLEDGDRLEVIDAAPACPPSLTHPLLHSLVADNGLTVRAKLGWTDVAQLAELGIPATNFGPGDAAVAHSADEHLERTSLEACYHALRRLLTTPATHTSP
jgi:succinyl-diaminopimelate desuccinylase